MRKIKVHWREFERNCRVIADEILKLKEHNKFLYGISRGGLPVAVYVSNFTDIPLIHSRTELVEKLRHNFGVDSAVIVIDDIIDEGKMMEKRCISFLDTPVENVYSAVLFMREYSKFMPTIAAEKVDINDWIVFPWEKGNEKEVGKFDKSEISKMKSEVIKK